MSTIGEFLCVAFCNHVDFVFQLVDQYTIPGTVHSWTDSLNGLSLHWYPLATAVLIFPVGMVRLIKYLVPFSVVANMCLLVGASAVFYFILWDNGQIPLELEERAKLVVWPATHWSLFTGSTLCSMEGVGMVKNCRLSGSHLRLCSAPREKEPVLGR